MSGYTELRDLGVSFRPPDGPMPPPLDQPSRFEASWPDTVRLLATELRNLTATRIVCEVSGLTEADLRNDGIPRASARLGDPVRVSFDSTYGPLRYETGTFTKRWYGDALDGWQANLRAIALGLEALRKVDRYGITKRGEQYTGWKALPASTDPADAVQTLEQARAVIDQWGGLTEALKATHPDRGGNPDDFRRVMRAKELIAG